MRNWSPWTRRCIVPEVAPTGKEGRTEGASRAVSSTGDSLGPTGLESASADALARKRPAFRRSDREPAWHLADEKLGEAESELASFFGGRLSHEITRGASRRRPRKKPRAKSRPSRDLVTGGADGARTRDLRIDSPVC